VRHVFSDWFRDSTDWQNDSVELWRRLNQDGYLLLRGIVPRLPLKDLRTRMLDVMAQAGWLDPSAPREHGVACDAHACGEPDPRFYNVYNKLFRIEALHALAHNPNILSLFETL